MNTSPIIPEPTMTSIEIAEATGKRHNDVLRAIRKMEPAWEKVRGRKFALTSKTTNMPNGAKREDPIFILTKTECLYIATKFNDEARAKLVLRWERLEMERITQPKVPALSRKQILLYALQAEEEAERLRDISLNLLCEKYKLESDIAQLRRTLDYIINK